MRCLILMALLLLALTLAPVVGAETLDLVDAPGLSDLLLEMLSSVLDWLGIDLSSADSDIPPDPPEIGAGLDPNG